MKKTRGTAQWAYRCTPHGTDGTETSRLLNEEGFLCRSLHNVDGHKIANVTGIEIGDTVHVYYIEAKAERYLAAYLIDAPARPVDPDVPAIDAIQDGDRFDRLVEAGYEVDPVLGYFTGFRVRKDDYATQPHVRPRWVARNAITRVDKK